MHGDDRIKIGHKSANQWNKKGEYKDLGTVINEDAYPGYSGNISCSKALLKSVFQRIFDKGADTAERGMKQLLIFMLCNTPAHNWARKLVGKEMNGY